MDHNLEWEDKNIILSLFLYLTLNYSIIKEKVIIINHQFYMSIAKEFFFKLTFKHKDKDKYQNKVRIYIKEISQNSGLYINNIHNFESIYNYKISLIPWYDIQNPLIMFYKEEGEQIMDKDSVYKSIIKFNKHLRYKNYNVVGLNKYRCSVNVWDTYYEIEIMKKFCLLYGMKNPFYINDYINRIVGCRLCKDKTMVPKIINRPVYPHGQFNNYIRGQSEFYYPNMKNAYKFSTPTPDKPEKRKHKGDSYTEESAPQVLTPVREVMTGDVDEPYIEGDSCYPSSLSNISYRNDEIAVVMAFGDTRETVGGALTEYGQFLINAPKQMSDLGSPYTIVLFENNVANWELISNLVKNIITPTRI